jgi:diketogulonate reductase-like aldo/keto reductase
MTYKNSASGVELPAIGFGTWTIGGSMTADHSHDDEGIARIREAVEIGYTHIDTAEMYGGGHTEELVGRALEDHDRGSLFITTKVSPSHLSYAEVHRAIERSLSRLKTDYVDLYLIHWPNPSVPLSQTFRALNELVEQGIVRHLGVSNFSARDTESARKLAATPLLTNQVEYSLLNREPDENGVRNYCEEHGVFLTAYEPLGKGRLPGAAQYEPVAAKYGISVSELGLAWLVAKPFVITIPKSTNPQHMRANFAAADIRISAEDLAALDQTAH